MINWLSSNLVDDKFFHDRVQNYFPDLMKAKYTKEISSHPLRKEIIATAITNEVINKMGPSFINNLRLKTGKSTEEIICAFYMTHQIYKFNDIWACLDSLSSKANLVIQNDLWSAIRKATAWLLNNHNNFTKIQLDSSYISQITMLEQNIMDSLSAQGKQDFDSMGRYLHTSWSGSKACQKSGHD